MISKWRSELDCLFPRTNWSNVLRYYSLLIICLHGRKRMKWVHSFPVQVPQKSFSQFEFPWLMKAEIIVQNKWIKGKQCTSTRVSFEQQRSTLHLVTNSQAPYLSTGCVPTLIICKWLSWGVKEGHMEDEPDRGGGVWVYFLQSVQRPSEGTTSLSNSALLFQLPHFYDSGLCEST